MDTIKTWAIAAGVRALKTAAQSFVACIGTSAVNIVDLDWPQIIGIAATAAVLSICTSIAGIAEADDGASLPSIVKSSKQV